jgi:hypothetical protein
MKNEIKELKLKEKVLKNYTLIEGDFYMKEALEILISLFDSKINHHKIKKMMKWSRNIDDKAKYDSTRIEQLIKDKDNVLELLKTIKDKNAKIKMHSVLQIVKINEN